MECHVCGQTKERVLYSPKGEKMSVVEQIAVSLTDEQREMAQIIEREFLRAGLSPEIVAGAIVNARYESSLNPRAVGDGGKSVGLFQLHESGGGAGMTVDERMDPVLNSQRMIEQVEKAGWGYLNQDKGDGLFNLEDAGETRVSEYAARFCRDVERPANKEFDCWQTRMAAAKEWFPGDTVRGGLWYRVMPSTRVGRIALGVSLIALVGVGGVLLYDWYEERR
jgi:hypothetical protein